MCRLRFRLVGMYMLAGDYYTGKGSGVGDER